MLLSRYRNIALAVTTVASLLSSIPSQAQSPISRDKLEWMFANIHKNMKWDLSHDMLWGYFFTNRSRQPLDSAAKDLAKQGYRVVDVFLSVKDRPTDSDLWWLHVERVETHSIESLDKRNTELAVFAQRHALDSYDGMDVGPVGGEH